MDYNGFPLMSGTTLQKNCIYFQREQTKGKLPGKYAIVVVTVEQMYTTVAVAITTTGTDDVATEEQVVTSPCVPGTLNPVFPETTKKN